MAWPIRSVRPQLSIRKPRSRWNLSVAALESRRLKELKQHSGLMMTTPEKKKPIRRWFQLETHADLTSVSVKHSTISL